MYKIELSKHIMTSNVKIIAENHDELSNVITNAPYAGYSVVSVEYVPPIQTAKEFLEELKKEQQPEDLVYGKGGFDLPINKEKEN